MSIEVIEINGKCSNLDYEAFELTLRETIGKTCSHAKVFLLNNFPASVSPESNIDLILAIAINPKEGNYYRVWKNKRWVYLYNLIMPINFIKNFSDEDLQIEGRQILLNNELIDYANEINSLKSCTLSYLSNRCNFNRRDLFIQPVVFIENKSEAILDNYIVAKSFDFTSIKDYLLNCSQDIFSSYRPWRNDPGYESVLNDIKRIAEQASKDSEVGYLTKKKIDRIGKQLASSRKIYEGIRNNLVIIQGKAGTGKSTELLLLTMKCINNGQNTLFLTYNKLLVFDIAKTVKSYKNSVEHSDPNSKHGEGAVLTLHAFFFRLSKSLGILHVLSFERIELLLSTFKERMRLIYDFVAVKHGAGNLDFELLKSEIQNRETFDIGTKEVGLDFINYLKRKSYSSDFDLKACSLEFFRYKKRLLEGIGNNEIFLADYYGVLEETLLAIQNSGSYFKKYNIQDKYELLEDVLNLQDKHIEKSGSKIKIKEKAFEEQKNRSVGGYRRKRTIFVDEAQDCHRLEKDILIAIYGSDNLVIANGGKEQLIRHVELCNWEVSQNKKLNIKKHFTRNKSFRVKKTVVDFCNYVANRFGIDFNMEPLESEDEGELIIDFRQDHTDNEIKEICDHLNHKGEVNGCTPYERLLVLLESNSQRSGVSNDNINESVVINEYGNIEDAKYKKRGSWKYLESLEKESGSFWDGTVSDKSQLNVPGSYESRVIYYESCRGLEAWSVACFALDKFFKIKRDEPDAERYLVDDLFLNQNNEQRKSMFATTWVIMAITRVIDTLYLQINDRNSEFGKVVIDYLKQKPKNARILG